MDRSERALISRLDSSFVESSQIDSETVVLRLDPGDDIHKCLQEVCIEHDIANAVVSGIGSVTDPVLAYFSVPDKRIIERELKGFFEVTSLQGNIGLVEDQPTAHLHVTVSDLDMNVLGGHLVSAKCSATVELVVRRLASSFTKALAPEIGLKVWQF